jgi:hypothetical protein
MIRGGSFAVSGGQLRLTKCTGCIAPNGSILVSGLPDHRGTLLSCNLANEFGAVGLQPGKDVVDVLNGEHDAPAVEQLDQQSFRRILAPPGVPMKAGCFKRSCLFFGRWKA